MNDLILLSALFIIIVLLVSVLWFSKDGNDSSDKIKYSISSNDEQGFLISNKPLIEKKEQPPPPEFAIPKEQTNVEYWGLEESLLFVFEKQSNVKKHFLYLNIVNESYKLRENKVLRELCKLMSERHISEFSSFKDSLMAEHGRLPRVPTFQHYATILTEDGDFEKAIQVCETAIAFNLKDGTKLDYQGRIARIESKMIKSSNQRK